jgi:recombinational DNA repair protein RecT
MSQKLIPEAQAQERMAEAIHAAKRKFEVQNGDSKRLEFSAEARFALTAIRNNNQLLKCEPSTVKDSMVHLAAMGLSLNPAAQQAALIPRWNSKANRLDCTASPQYRGLMKLATDTGLVNNITAEVVFLCEEDSFDVDLGSKPYLKHKPKLFAGQEERVIDLVSAEKNRLIGAYCIAHLRDSEHPHITVMDLAEILAVARASDAFNPRPPRGSQTARKPSGPWVYWAGEMIKKAVIRRATKQWPQSDDSNYQRLLTAVEIDNMAEANEQRAEVRSDEIESDMGSLLTAEMVAKIKDLCSTQELPLERVYENYNVNSLSKVPMKFFDEIEEKLLDRQRKWNAAQEAKAPEDHVEKDAETADVPA